MGFEPTKVCKNCQKGGARILALDGICWHIWIRPGIDVALLQQNCLQAAHRWEGAHERWPKSAGQILIQLGDWMIVICSGNLRRQRKSTIIYIYKYRFLGKNMFYAFNIYIYMHMCMHVYIYIYPYRNSCSLRLYLFGAFYEVVSDLLLTWKNDAYICDTILHTVSCSLERVEM